MIERLRSVIVAHLDELCAMDPDERLEQRYVRLRGLGNGIEPLDPPEDAPRTE